MKLKIKISIVIVITIIFSFLVSAFVAYNFSKNVLYHQFESDQFNILNSIEVYLKTIYDYENKIAATAGGQFNPRSEEFLGRLKSIMEWYLEKINTDEFFIINTKGNVISMTSSETDNVLNLKDASGNLYFVKIVDTKNGKLKFVENIKTKRKNLEVGKIVFYKYFSSIDWIVGLVTKEESLLKKFDEIFNKIFIAGIIVIAVNILIVMVCLVMILDRPLKEINELLLKIKRGDYNIKSDKISEGDNELNSIRALIMDTQMSLNYKLNELTNEKKKIEDFLNKLAESIIKVRSGDLTKLVEVNSKEDVNNIGQSFNYAIIKFNKLISKLFDTAAILSDSTVELQTTSKEFNSIIQNQTDRISEITSAINETTSSISGIASNSKNAQQISTVAKEKAKEGGISVQQAIDGMEKIQERVQEIARSISQLGESGQQIGKIVGVITQISDQTSLLALNAAIEAARAGEQGRGFAVVADEVGKLAKRVAESAKEIQELIETIQQQTDVAVKGMQKGMEEVAYGTDLVQRTGQSLNEIISVVDKTGKIIDEISNTVNEQAAVTDNIAHSANKIIDSSNEVSKATEESVKKINNLNTSMLEFKSMIDEYQIINKKELAQMVVEEVRDYNKTEEKSLINKKGIKLAEQA